MHAEDLQEEFDRFIEFGTLLDRPTRCYLARYLQETLLPPEQWMADEGLSAKINDTYYSYFTRALDRIFASEDLQALVKKQPALSHQIAAETLHWLRKAYEKLTEENPYEAEASRIRAASVMPLRRWVERWYLTTDFLKNEYDREELDARFYEKKFEELIGKRQHDELSERERSQVERIIHDLLAQWDALLQSRLLAYQLRKLEEEQEDFKDQLESKVNEFQKLSSILSPFAEYVGKYWDMSRELWEDADFDLLAQYQDLLQDEASIRELADLLGRMREAEIVTEEEVYERRIEQKFWHEPTDDRAEIVGIRESNDLNALLSSEVGLLADEDTELAFLQKFADSRLLSFRYEDQVLRRSEDEYLEVDRRVKRREKGPFIICVDTSDSMSGRAERIAKVLCFAIMKIAAEDQRKAFLINFSVGIKTIDLADVGDSLSAIADFLRMSFHGGTDLTLALHETLRQLQEHHYRDADVLIISDFIMYRLDEEALKRVRHHQHNQHTQFHSLILHHDPNAEVLAEFDTNWLYDPRKKGVIRELAGELRELRDR